MLCAALFLNEARGPFWLGSNYDPEYAYLLSSLNIATGKSSYFVEHPGVTLQNIGSFIINGAYAVEGRTDYDLQNSVIKNPEKFINLIYFSLLFAIFLVLLFIGWISYFYSKSIPLSLIMQISPFFYNTTITYGLMRVSPEPVLLVTGLLFSLLLLVYLYVNMEKEGQFERKSPCTENTNLLFILLFSILSGFGLATKLSFIPLLIIPLIVIPLFRNKIYYILLTFISFIGFIYNFAGRYLVYTKARDIITHVGSYGSGEKGIIDPAKFLHYLREIVLSWNILFSAFLLFSILLILAKLLLKRQNIFKDLKYKILFGIVLSNLIGIIIVAKHPGIHYLVPVYSLCGLTVVLSWLCIKDMCLKLGSKGMALVKALPSLVCFIILCTATWSICEDYARYSSNKNNLLQIYEIGETKYKEYGKIYFYRASSPASALEFGNIFASRVYAKTLQENYPNVWFYDIWNKMFYNWEGNPVNFDDVLLKNNGRVLMQGTWYGEKHHYMPDFPLNKVFSVNSLWWKECILMPHSLNSYGI